MDRKKRRIRRERVRRRNITILILAVVFVIVSISSAIFIIHNNGKEKSKTDIVVKDENKSKKDNKKENKKEDEKVSDEKKEIVISAIGDLTLGTDTKFNYIGSFDEAVDNYNKDYSKFMKNVVDVLGKDDYTIGNLETTFTNQIIKLLKVEKLCITLKVIKNMLIY